MKRGVDRLRSERQISYFRATRARRRATADSFRAKLLEELGGEAALSASQIALVGTCVSAHVEVDELTGMFVRGSATPERGRQLSLARGQLQRCLRSLGLIDKTDGDDAPIATIDDLLAPYRTQKESDIAETIPVE